MLKRIMSGVCGLLDMGTGGRNKCQGTLVDPSWQLGG